MDFSAINNRKIEHLRICLEEQSVDRNRRAFDEVFLNHRALPELDFSEVDTSIEFLGKRISLPLIISSITGGAGDEIAKINRNLAEAAEAENVALAVGSQRVYFSDPNSAPSFQLRDFAPTIPLIGNLGAVQLNYGVGADDCRKLADLLQADAFYLHLNPLQEAIQPEGDTNFSGLADKIAEIVKNFDLPILIKEVGSGISPSDAELLISAGVKYIDVAGAGGTSWSEIEAFRSADSSLGNLFADWGIPTPIALKQLNRYRDRATLIASGGIRSGIDMAKAMVLGASLCGSAIPFLAPAMESADAVRAKIQQFKREFKTAQFLLGCAYARDLIGNENLLIK